MSTPEPPVGDPAVRPADAADRGRRDSRVPGSGTASARCCPTTRPGSATSGSTRGSAPPRPGSLSPPTTTRTPPAMVIMLSEGAAADAAARARFAGEINAMHIDTVLARGGQGQDTGRLGRKFRSEDDDPMAPDERQVAPWVALAYDGSPGRGGRGRADADEVQLATLPPQGTPSGRTTSSTGSTGCGPGWPGCGRCRGRAVRPGRLADDPGLLAADAAARRSGRADRDPDLPQPATADTPAADRRLGQPAAPVRFTVAPVGSPSPQSGSPSPQSGSPSPQSGSPSGSPSDSGSPSPSGSARRRPRAPRPAAVSRPGSVRVAG